MTASGEALSCGAGRAMTATEGGSDESEIIMIFGLA
jgi:hypothetical protein